MKCQDCVEKKVNEPTRSIYEAKYVLVDDDFLRLLCETCHHEYVQAYGDIVMDLESFHLETELEQVFKKISEAYKFRVEQYKRLLKEYSELKKAMEPEG